MKIAQRIRVRIPFTGLCLTVTALLGLAAETQAGVILSVEAPKVVSTQVPGVTTENFNGFSVGTLPNGTSTAVGTISGGSILAANVFGGANGSNYLAGIGSNTVTLNLPGAQSYFGFWWSAADGNNVAEFFSGSTLVATFKPSTTLAALSSCLQRQSHCWPRPRR